MSKRITLDNLKTFLTQLKTHITDPIKNDVSTLNTKVRNAENNIITANSNISSVQQALNNKADKNHTHNYLSLNGGTMTGSITFPQGFGIESYTNTGKGLIKESSTSVNLGFTGKAMQLYGSSISYTNSSGNKYDILHSGNIDNNKFATLVNVKNYITNSDLFTFVDDEHTQYKFTKNGLYRITATTPRTINYGLSFCDNSLDFETKGNVLIGNNVGLYQPITNSLIIYINNTKIYEFFGFDTSEYHGATEYIKYRGAEFKTNLQGTNILIELIKEC